MLSFFSLHLVLLIFTIQQALGQHVIKNLVFEGGGIRGIAYAGALEELQNRNMLDSVERVTGTSAGAIAAALYALGYSPSEISDLIVDLNLKKFADGRGVFIGGTKRFFKYYGWYRGEQFEKWLSEIIRGKTGKEDLTFKELENLANENRNFRKLYVTGTNLSEQRLTVFCSSTFPDMEIRTAVRISISIPLFYQAVIIDAKGKVIRKKKDQVHGMVMVDGGMIANFPIQIFDYNCYMSPYGDSSKVINFQTLGLRLDREEQIEYDRQNMGLAPYEIHKFRDYIQAFYNIIIENLNRQNLSDNDWKRTVSISTEGIGPKIRKLNAKEKEILLESGRKAVRVFLIN